MDAGCSHSASLVPKEKKRMAAWRILGSFVVTLVVAGTGQGQTCELAETPKAGDCLRVQLAMSLTGEMRVTKNNQLMPLQMTASATHEFSERVLAPGANGLLQKTARSYDKANATIAVGTDRSERKLRPDRCLLVAQQSKGQLLIYSPAGPLTRAELELTSEHFDTLSLGGLLPGKAVKVGETWKIANEVAQALCNFEGLTTQDLVCKLEKVTDQTAQVSVTGSASGIDLGALVKLTVEATYQFDLSTHRLTRLTWKQKDERGQGPASPATTVETTTQMTRTIISQPECLSDIALISVPEGDPPATMMQLSYHHETKTPFDLVHSRDWQLVGQTAEHVVFRLLDRGDFVAQLTITPWEKARAGGHIAPEAFKEAMAKTPGWEQGEVVQEGEIPADAGRWIFRISAPGKMDGLQVVQNFYIVAGPGGEQVVLAFTMTPKQAEKLGTRDLDVVQALAFPTKAKD
jgi:hypothetical protein